MLSNLCLIMPAPIPPHPRPQGLARGPPPLLPQAQPQGSAFPLEVPLSEGVRGRHRSLRAPARPLPTLTWERGRSEASSGRVWLPSATRRPWWSGMGMGELQEKQSAPKPPPACPVRSH